MEEVHQGICGPHMNYQEDSKDRVLLENNGN